MRKNKKHFPIRLINQPVKNPTMRWIFQIMEGIGLIRFYEKHIEKPVREVISNLGCIAAKNYYAARTLCSRNIRNCLVEIAGM